MQIFKFLAALLAIATLGVVGCGEKEAANSGTEGQYASPESMSGDAGDMADPGEEAPAEEAPAEEAVTEEPAEEASSDSKEPEVTWRTSGDTSGNQ